MANFLFNLSFVDVVLNYTEADFKRLFDFHIVQK